MVIYNVILWLVYFVKEKKKNWLSNFIKLCNQVPKEVARFRIKVSLLALSSSIRHDPHSSFPPHYSAITFTEMQPSLQLSFFLTGYVLYFTAVCGSLTASYFTLWNHIQYYKMN